MIEIIIKIMKIHYNSFVSPRNHSNYISLIISHVSF